MNAVRMRLRACTSRLTYANVVATLALVAVIGSGGAYAATKIDGRLLKKGSVHTAAIATGAVTADKLAPGVAVQGPAGPQGATGPQGPAGPPGSPDTTSFYDKAASDARFQSRLDRVTVLGGGTATANGAALLAAVAAIPAPTGAGDAWLVVLQPGVYDLGSATLTLKPYVDLAGSGAGTTTVTSSKDAAPGATTISMASNSAIRDLTVAASTTTRTSSVAVFVENGVNGASVRDAVLTASGGAFAQGLLVNGGTATMDRSTATATTSGTNVQAFAVDSFGTLIVRDSSLTATVGTGGLAGVGVIKQGGANTVVMNTVVKASQYAVYNTTSAAPVRVVTSQLDAPTTSSGLTSCTGAYNSSYAALSATCT